MNKTPNKLPAVDAAIPLPFHVARHWRGATEAGRWATQTHHNKYEHMKTRRKLIPLALTAALLTFAGCATAPHATTPCEYRVIQGVTDAPEFETTLNKTGSEGFNIVSSTLIPKEQGIRQQVLVILKRVK